MPYAQPDPDLVNAKLLLIDEWASDAPLAPSEAEAQLKWWVGPGSNHLVEAHMACDTGGPISGDQLERVVSIALQYAARTLAALRAYTSEDFTAGMSPTRTRLAALVEDYAASTASASYTEEFIGMDPDVVLLEQFATPITARSPSMTFEPNPTPQRLYELAFGVIGDVATFLAAAEHRPEYIDPYA